MSATDTFMIWRGTEIAVRISYVWHRSWPGTHLDPPEPGGAEITDLHAYLGPSPGPIPNLIPVPLSQLDAATLEHLQEVASYDD